MCGIVSYYGRPDGVDKVLNALELLAYRAPDSSGLAAIDAEGRLVIRRAVGNAEKLRTELAQNPLPPLAKGEVQVVVGHGRWAMVGGVSQRNAHPISDRSCNRVICENGSHNPQLMLGRMDEQERWWRERGVPSQEPVHRTENTSEVLAFEWERNVIRLRENSLPTGSAAFTRRLIRHGIVDVEEQALRLAMWELREGNAHACAFFSRHKPDTLYVTSHDKPVTIASRRDAGGRPSIMVASDVNAALMLWPKATVEAAAACIEAFKAQRGSQEAIDALLDELAVEVIFLDKDLHGGKELFASIHPGEGEAADEPAVEITHYDGSPVSASATRLRINPSMVGKKGYPSFTECHLAEIPDVLIGLINAYVRDGRVHMESAWRDGRPLAPGLNLHRLQERFGPKLERLDKVWLVGEGSSWRDGLAAAPLFRYQLPGVQVNVVRPVEALNLGLAVDPESQLAVEVSWSGTTDSLLKVDGWLEDQGLLRLGVTGRPQSDLGRRTATSAGLLNVHTGVEVSVATVKGYEAILLTLNLLALQLGSLKSRDERADDRRSQVRELAGLIPQQLRQLIGDGERRRQIRRIGEHCRMFNKVNVVGAGPVVIEAELKIEELAQIVARASSFSDPSLGPLIERSSLSAEEQRQVLFIINATSPDVLMPAHRLVSQLEQLGLFCLVHTIPNDLLDTWQVMKNVAVFASPQVSTSLQPLIDAPFFFELAVALAYGRGLSAEEVDKPRNLAKSVTTTGAERRAEVEARREFPSISIAQFTNSQADSYVWRGRAWSTREQMRLALTLREAIDVSSKTLPQSLRGRPVNLLVFVDNEISHNGVLMAASAWGELCDIELEAGASEPGASSLPGANGAWLRLTQAGAAPRFLDESTLALPADISPLLLELATASFLMGIAVHVAQDSGLPEGDRWQEGLRRLPIVLAELMVEENLRRRVGAVLAPLVAEGYDKVQVIGGGQDHIAAISMARSLRLVGIMAEALYTDSAWHGPLAAVGGPDAEHDTLIIILATDPLFQVAALVDTQVYRVRRSKVILVVPEGNDLLPAVLGAGATAVLTVPPAPRPMLPIISAVFGSVVAEEMDGLWSERSTWRPEHEGRD